ncbi:MAG: DUF305 domain-containing protein [Actinomycetes bacterium]
MSTRKLARVVGPVAAAALLVLAGCGADDSTSSASSADHNDADVTFAQDMIPHHQQALVMADVAIEGASTEELQQLAERIQDAQAPEIEAMTGWLESWDEEVPDLDAMGHMMMGHGDDDDDNDMPGMMDADQMQQMSSMAGDGLGFDRMWVLMMIEHHEGAIEMAQDEKVDGQSADAIALADAIVTAQKAEIDEMQQMLDDWQN